MSVRLVQVELAGGARCVAALEPGRPGRSGGIEAVRLEGIRSVYELAGAAIAEGRSLGETARQRLGSEILEVGGGDTTHRLLAPIDHPDPAHLYLTGTGLTHLGSAESRDRMHALAAQDGAQTDSMRMFLDGLEGGKPAAGLVGSQPEWFYKGDGSSIVGTGAPLEMPPFARDGGEEPEIAGIYLIDPAGEARRLGFCLANEFSDHLTERENYLWLAHSKLRPAALGPELLSGPLPADVRGTSRVRRGSQVIWEKPFLTGETNMSHSIANLEHHHFKYDNFRRPGDVHVHFFGTATLSFSDQVRLEPGDLFDISADAFLLPLRNELARSSSRSFTVRPL
ncbi:MAG TPA: AraD1 family protein [Steroidobacteraceae bacterium]|nr:AraD1 family protein [Steroidobacteraceae bacterium]